MEASPVHHAPRARVWSLQPDGLLCRAGARGNQAAFEELHRRYHRQLSAFVFHMLGGRHRREDTEEIVQDTFARAFSQVRDHEFEGSFRAWLYAIARNRAIDVMRTERMVLVPLDEGGANELPRTDTASEPVAAAESREDLAWLVRAIGELPERQRSALLLRELGDLSHDAIADSLGTTTGSVRQLIGRGRDHVRRAAEADSAAPKSLRRGLIEAAPWVPVAAIGGVVAGSGAGAGGLLALGKFAAALIAVAAVAGSAGTIERQVSAAPDPRGTAEPAAQSARAETAATHRPVNKRTAAAESHSGGDSLRGEVVRGEKRADSDGTATGGHTDSSSGERSSAERSEPKAPAVQTPPLEPVTDLPGKVLDDVGSVLDGSKSLPEAVGDITDNTLDTVGQTTENLLDPLTSR